MNEIDALRRFNRFYTRVLGLFHPRLMGSGQTLLEARILYEVWRLPGMSSSDLVRRLDVDRGHLSRVLGRLVRQGLIFKEEKHAGRRAIPLTLTAKGTRVMRELDGMSGRQAATLLAPLDAGRRRRLVRALSHVEATLSEPSGARLEIVLRRAGVGDWGRVIERHAALYGESHGFDADFEKYVLLGMADFLRGESARSRLWIAEQGGHFLGSVAVVETDSNMAQLRWLLVEPMARGQGVGRLLAERAVAFGLEQGYGGIFLWTLESLAPAKALYASLGFALTQAVAGSMGGVDCVEERWEMSF